MAFSLYTVLVLAVLAASCSALTDEKKAEIREKLVAHIRECGPDYGMTPESLKEFKAQKKQPDDTNKCFFACMFKRIGLMDSQGLYSEDVAIQKVSQYAEESNLENAKAAAKACTTVNEEAVSDGEAGCDRAKLLFTCITKQKEVYGFGF